MRGDRRERIDLPRQTAEYWRHRRVWDRWLVEKEGMRAGYKHSIQRELTTTYIKSVRRSSALIVADLCCGTGRVTADLLALPNVATVTAVDISAHALDILSERLRTHADQNKLTKVCQDVVSHLQNRSAKYDLIVCMDALHHLSDLGSFLPLIASSLSADGLFIGNFLLRSAVSVHGKAKWGVGRYYGTMFLMKLATLLWHLWPRLGNQLAKFGLIRLQLRDEAEITSLLEENFEISATHIDSYLWFTAARLTR